MIGDCLLPVYTSEGPGTLVTCKGKPVLIEGMKFESLDFDMLDIQKSNYYTIEFKVAAIYGKSIKTRLILTGNIRLKTFDGWKSIDEINRNTKKNNLLTIKVSILKTVCIICGDSYFWDKPLWRVCCRECKKLANKNKIFDYKLITEKNIKYAKKEAWADILSITKTVSMYSGYDVLKIKNKTLYVRDVLIGSGEE